jgi:hypothetical protein
VSDRRHDIIPALQVTWVVVYWWALLVNLYLFGVAIANETTQLYQFVVLALACAAVVIGASFATRIARRGVTDLAFLKGTTTIRVVSVGWIMVGCVLIVVPIFEVLSNTETGGIAIANGLIGTIGTLSVLAMVGPGYVEYRDAITSEPASAPSESRTPTP